MRYINKNSNRGIVNIFADFILKKINRDFEYDTVIEVTDCGKFFVVNGMTNSKTSLNMSEVRDEFIEFNKLLLLEFGYEDINIVDLIMYGVELEKKESFWFTYYNTDRPIYPNEVLNSVNNNYKFNSISFSNVLTYELDFSQESELVDSVFEYSPLNISSEFPYGYSLNMGRLHMYYGEYISNQLLNVIFSNEITMKISTIKDDNGDFKFDIITESMYLDETIKSMVLDVFDFNLMRFKNKLKDYDLSNDLLDPLGEKPWLVKDKRTELIIF